MKNKKNIIIIICIILVLFVFILNLFINNTKIFKKYINNPIISGTGKNSLFDPYVIKIDNIFYMYVSNRNERCIDVYCSKDGVEWEEKNTVFKYNEQTGWEKDINRCCVIYNPTESIYKMWYTGQENGMSKIGYAEGVNPFYFERKQNEPVIEPTENFEKESVMNPYVIYDENLKSYKMWYTAGEQYEPDVIGYATSLDGIKWEKRTEPIFKANTDGNFYDSYKVGACEVKLINNEYYMFYIGYSDINTAYIMCAKSNNGISNWEKIYNKPIITSTKYSFDEKACYKPSIYIDYKNNQIMLWYNGRNNIKEAIGLATAKLSDFINNQK